MDTDDMTEDNLGINYGNGPEILDSFEISLKSYDEGRKKFIIMKMTTCHGEAEFILLPEELSVIGDICKKVVNGMELREDYFPNVTDEVTRKEMFPDI